MNKVYIVHYNNEIEECSLLGRRIKDGFISYNVETAYGNEWLHEIRNNTFYQIAESKEEALKICEQNIRKKVIHVKILSKPIAELKVNYNKAKERFK